MVVPFRARGSGVEGNIFCAQAFLVFAQFTEGNFTDGQRDAGDFLLGGQRHQVGQSAFFEQFDIENSAVGFAAQADRTVILQDVSVAIVLKPADQFFFKKPVPDGA
jgi:hypothetical protein